MALLCCMGQINTLCKLEQHREEGVKEEKKA